MNDVSLGRASVLVPLLLTLAPACWFDDDDAGARFVDARPPLADAWRAVDATPPDAEPPPDADLAPLSCTEPLPCPSASPGRVTVCGRLYDVETDAQIRAVTETAGLCGVDVVSGGACDLQVRFYDALDFASNPTAAAPLPVEDFRLDDCGRYVAHNITRPALGFLGIVVDDAPGAADQRRLTGSALAVSSAQVLPWQRTYSIRRATDAAWTTGAGLAGDSLVDRGVIWKLFLDGSTPVAGVTITASGSVRPADDFYFSDTAPYIRSTIAPDQTATGANGSALMINSALVDHGGRGAEPGTCTWESGLAASIPGTLLVSPTSLIGQPCT